MSALEQQMKHRDHDMVPLFLVRSMFGLMFAALCLVAYAQWADVPQSAVYQETPIVAQMDVQFVSSREGMSTVFDMDGNQIAASGDDKMGFIGVIGIAVRREREVAGLANDTPITILKRESGTYGIHDPATGWSMELIGYGADNVAAFAKLLD
ncbi:photosynthetic complex assembly protein [Octadecabacter sp. G9-8]|uniref:Photosynthetic complex assembly protein n=1 Tax=Octadecabacter dasysiphoniae TaxID=2909341 RepID=A0ABS9CXK4_9RHOB|nr:photosynthetic complex assembly protein PuhC [Octadecabacter dasysiphoniae]MCF2871567.1 photosynthetic complex assembly protein [Octadecabacter dasysiphoniae]